MTDQELSQIFSLGHETSGIELKGPGPRSNRRLFAQVVKAVLGMANRRDGGRVIIGVEDASGTVRPVGLNQEDLSTWRYDDIADGIASYADPSVSFDREVREYNGDKYLILMIREFTDVPILCKRDYQGVLRSGACYVRSRRKPETSEIPTQEDMRDLLELATEKRLREHLALLQRIGLIVLPSMGPQSTERFEQQRGNFGG